MPNKLLTIDIGGKRPYELEITHHDLPLRGLPSAWQGRLCVQLTDLHAGCGNIEPVHERMVQEVEALQPDLILYTGDYIDRRTSRPAKEFTILEVMRATKAPFGKFGVFGNHDHYRGIVGTSRLLEQADVRPLLNENIVLPDGLHLAGIDDIRTGSPHITQALANIPLNSSSLILTHNPTLFDHLPNQDLVVFAGHTHGGQIVPPFIPASWIVRIRLGCRFVSGWYERGKSRMYVSRGIGVTRTPMRYNCPAEIAVFRLVNADSEEGKR